MYLDYYNFRQEPFSLTPDPKFYFLSRKHEEAIETLLFGINNRKGFMTLVGDIGTGKTTTCRTLIDRLDKNTDVSMIFNPMLSILELLESINDDFGNKDAVGDSVKLQLDALNSFLLRRLRWNKNALVIIDEAQNLSVEALEMLRLLSNLETEEKKLLQILFIGQLELVKKLDSPELRQLNQRMIIKCQLTPLNYTETCQYVIHRIQIAAFSNLPKVKFEERALKRMFDYTRGVPRLINILSDRVLMEAFSRRGMVVDESMARQAVSDLEGGFDTSAIGRIRPWQILRRIASLVR